MQIFNSNNVAFGRHESFALRFSWLTKGFQQFEEDKNIFSAEDAVVRLGVGKNMVNSIRHWLRAAQLIRIESDEKTTTPIGNFLFSKQGGKDPYLEDEGTIWLIHWLIVTNPVQATSWYWFFNLFHKPEFTGQEAANALVDFAKENIAVNFSISTLKKDCAVLLRTYSQSKASLKTPPEEALDSPLSLLRLITYSTATKKYQSRFERRDNLPLGIFGYAIADLFKKSGWSEIPIEDLMYGKKGYLAPGLAFRLSENGLLEKIEQLIHYLPGKLKLDETAGIHQLYCLQALEPIDYLKKHYNMQMHPPKAA